MSEEKVIEEEIHFRFASIHVLAKRVEEAKKENIDKPNNFRVTVETRVQDSAKLVIPYVYVKIYFDDVEKSDKFYKAIDAVKNRFGKGKIQKARTVK